MGLILRSPETRTTRLENFSSVASGLLSIGRARDNDLQTIPSTPITGNYLRRTRTWSTIWVLRTAVSVAKSVNDCALTSADVLTLGKTRLQFFDPSHQVAPALSLHNSRQRLLSFNTWSPAAYCSSARY